MTSAITDTALALGDWVELSILSKATVILLLGFTAARLAARARASVRHLLLATTFAAILALPLIALLAPGVTFDVPVSRASDAIADSGDELRSEARVSSTGSAGVVQRRIPESSAWSAPSWSSIARLLWVAGALMMLVSPAVGLWRLRRVRREGLPWPELRELVQSLATGCGIRRPVEILMHEEIPAPLTFGVFRPAIVLPCDAREWTEADLRRALVHELEHVRRGDWAMQLFARATCAVYWFHPLVWVAWRRLRLEAERSSDDAVLESAERTEYAEQLVLLARRLSKAHGVAALGMANRSDLSVRVSTLLDETQRRGRAGLLVAVSAMCVACLVVFAIAPVRAVAQSAKRFAVKRYESGPLAAKPGESGQLVTKPAGGSGPLVARPGELGPLVAEPGELGPLVAEPGELGQLVAEPGESGQLVANQLLEDRTLPEDPVLNQPHQERQKGRSEPLDRVLFEAAESGDTTAIEGLLDAGANVNSALEGDGTPLMGAAHRGHVAAVRLLLDRGADPNMSVHGDGSPLIMAAREGYVDVVTLLLDRGADPNLAVRGDGNPLIMAAREGHLAVVTLLLDRGANIDKIVPEDENALIQSSGAGHLKVVKLLVSRGANVNARAWAEKAFERPDGEWRTPLSMARKGRHDAVVAFLLEAGARD